MEFRASVAVSTAHFHFTTAQTVIILDTTICPATYFSVGVGVSPYVGSLVIMAMDSHLVDASSILGRRTVR